MRLNKKNSVSKNSHILRESTFYPLKNNLNIFVLVSCFIAISYALKKIPCYIP